MAHPNTGNDTAPAPSPRPAPRLPKPHHARGLSPFVGMDGVQPGDPRRGARAVIAAMAQNPPPRRLVLGNSGCDAVIDTLEQALADIQANEMLSRSADFPT